MRIKKILILIISLQVYSKAFAIILYSPPVTTHEGWHFGIQGLYIQSHFGTETGASSSKNYTLPPGWSAGYKTQLSYLFKENLDINLTWLYFNNTIDQTIQSEDNLSGHYTVNQFGTGIANYTNSSTSSINTLMTNVNNKANTINFEFGRSMAFTDHLDIRIEMGAQYASVEQALEQTASDSTIDSQFNYNNNQVNAQFNGIGPRAGFDLDYKLGYGFYLVSSVAGALPLGQGKLTSVAHQSNETNTGLGNTVTTSGSKWETIFDYSAAFTFRYEKILLNSKIGFDIGYQITDFDIAEQSGWVLGARIIH